MNSNTALNAYQQIEVNGATRTRLVVMLYDGAIRFLRDAKISVEGKNARGRTIAVNRALAILGELQSTLDFEEGGEVSQSLDRIYSYLTARILDANMKGNTDGIDEAIKLLRILNSGWTEIAANSEPVAAPPAASVGTADPGARNRSAMEFFG